MRQSKYFPQVKDPCPVFDGTFYHIYATGGHAKFFHGVSNNITGPFYECEPIYVEDIDIDDDFVCAPGVIYDNGMFHMFVHSHFNMKNSYIYYLTSTDGNNFKCERVALGLNDNELGMYDVHPAIIDGKKYLVYSATKSENVENGWRAQPDIFLATADYWFGPWKRLGCILSHEDIVEHHNQIGADNYEWGIEGPQLIEYNGTVILNATCFLSEGEYGTRQRVFLASSDNVMGPYKSWGPIISTCVFGKENGHAAALIDKNDLVLFFQSRNETEPSNDWKYHVTKLLNFDSFINSYTK